MNVIYCIKWPSTFVYYAIVWRPKMTKSYCMTHVLMMFVQRSVKVVSSHRKKYVWDNFRLLFLADGLIGTCSHRAIVVVMLVYWCSADARLLVNNQNYLQHAYAQKFKMTQNYQRFGRNPSISRTDVILPSSSWSLFNVLILFCIV